MCVSPLDEADRSRLQVKFSNRPATRSPGGGPIAAGWLTSAPSFHDATGERRYGDRAQRGAERIVDGVVSSAVTTGPTSSRT